MSEERNEVFRKNEELSFNAYRQYLDGKLSKYYVDEDNKELTYVVFGEDFPLHFICSFYGNVASVQGFVVNISDEKLTELMVAANVANAAILNGRFSVLHEGQRVLFHLTHYIGSAPLDEDLCEYLFHVSLMTLDDFNDSFFALEKGYITLDDFIQKYM